MNARLTSLLLTLPLLYGGGPPSATAAADRAEPDGAAHPGEIEPASPRPVMAPAMLSVAAPALQPAPTWRSRIDARLRALEGIAARERDRQDGAPGLLATTLAELTHGAEGRAEIGVAVHELDSGAPVFHHDAERTLNPASNLKLLTAIAAVELLGADYRFTTRVLASGDTLFIVGEGDPSLQVEDVAGLAARTAAAAGAGPIRRIVVDDGFFSERRRAPGYDDGGPGFSYLAPSGALSLQWNTVEIAVRPGRPGEPPQVTTSPDCPHLRIDNRATTGRGGPLSIATAPAGAAPDGGEATIVSVEGRISARAKTVRIRRRVTDPALYFGETFADRFAAIHQGPRPIVERGRAPEGAALVADHHSAPLPEVLTSALAYSNNFTTEQVLRTLGARASGEPGDWANGRAVIERFWTTIGRDPDELRFVNASGYGSGDRTSRISADAIVALLSLTAREQSPSAALVSTLPTPGGHGTLRGRLGRARGHVRAKTGTLRGASALSGIVQTQAGHRYGFSILVNGRLSSVASRRIQDRIVTALVELG